MPLYENKQTLDAESRIMSVISEWRGCGFKKLPISYGVDYAAFKGPQRDVIAFVEIKNRAYPSDMDFLILDVTKYIAGSRLAIAASVPFIVVFGFRDGVIKWARLDDKKFEVCIHGRSGRGDRDDIEPVIRIYQKDLFVVPGARCLR